MKKILVPTDFSDLSQHAVDFAAKLAKPLNAELAVIHFIDVPLDDTSLHLTGEAHASGISEDSLYNAQLFRANNAKLQELSDRYAENGLVVTGQQLGGGFLKGIEDYLEKQGADLVVIGTTGEESIQEFFTGNHTEQLIEHLDVPVLSIQHEFDEKLKDIVLGLDLIDEKYSMKAFEMVKTMTESLDARLHIVNVLKSDIPESLISDLNKTAKIVGLTNFTVDAISSNNENEGLMDFAESVGASMIITLSEARSGIYRFFQHSFSTRLTKKSSLPVLTINKRHLV